jgi:hypothetical protein
MATLSNSSVYEIKRRSVELCSYAEELLRDLGESIRPKTERAASPV